MFECFNDEMLGKMREVNFPDVGLTSLVNVKHLKTDESECSDQKLFNYLTAVGNPYCFRVDKTPVRVRFLNENKTLGQSVGNYFISLK